MTVASCTRVQEAFSFGKEYGYPFKRLSETLKASQDETPPPAAIEIQLLYPGVHANLYHRLAHFLFRNNLRFLAPRYPSEPILDRNRDPSGRRNRPPLSSIMEWALFRETAQVATTCSSTRCDLGGHGQGEGKRTPPSQ
jgi:serine O-acetyltransferase